MTIVSNISIRISCIVSSKSVKCVKTNKVQQNNESLS